MNKKIIIENIEKRISEWKEDREKIAKDKFSNYLHSKSIDYSISDIVITELIDLLNFVSQVESVVGGKDEQ